MDFEFFKLQRQVKRSGECRRRNCAELPQAYCTPNVRKSLSNFGGKSKEIFDFSVK